MNETWRPCPIAVVSDTYEVSSHGRLRRVKPAKGGRVGHILKPKSTGQYLGWSLNGNGYRKVHYVHELVALAFIGPRPTGHQINHKNLNKTDNRVENLEYLTHQQNAQHAAAHGVNGKLTNAEREEIRRLYQSGVRRCVLARAFGVHPTRVWQIGKGYTNRVGKVRRFDQRSEK